MVLFDKFWYILVRFQIDWICFGLKKDYICLLWIWKVILGFGQVLLGISKFGRFDELGLIGIWFEYDVDRLGQEMEMKVSVTHTSLDQSTQRYFIYLSGLSSDK